MNSKYSKENVQIGDRVLVSGCGSNRDWHWGTVLGYMGTIAVNVRMDDSTLRSAKAFNSGLEERYYRAYWGEVHDCIPADKVAMHEGKPVNVEYHGQPANPLQKVIDDLTATHRYLEQVTGKKYAAHLQGVALDTGNGYDSNEVTIKFLMEEEN